jgi:hypothetical protein
MAAKNDAVMLTLAVTILMIPNHSDQTPCAGMWVARDRVPSQLPI